MAITHHLPPLVAGLHKLSYLESILDIFKYESWYTVFKLHTVGKFFQSHHFFEWIDPQDGAPQLLQVDLSLVLPIYNHG